MPLPITQELTRMLTAAPSPVVKDDNPGSFFQVIAAVGPKISFFGFPAAGIELGHGRFISMERAAFQQMLNQPIHQGLQRHPYAAYPFRHRGAGQNDVVAAVMVSQLRQAYCGRMWRWTKNLAGSTSSCSVMSSPILTKS